MAKLTLTDLQNLANEATAVSNINTNSAQIEIALENTLSRDGTSPNTMGASLDMNSNQIINLPAATSSTEPVRYAEFFDAIDTDTVFDFPLTSPGLVTVTDAETVVMRTITGTANEITVTEGDGGSGNPTLSLPTSLTFTGKTVTGGTFSSPSISTPTITGDLTLDNTGLHPLDTNASHDLIIAPGSNLTADRTLTLTTGDSSRTLTISGDSTVNQDPSTTADPTFNTIKINDSNDSHQLTIAAGSDLTAARTLTLTTGDASRTLTLGADVSVNQNVTTTSSPSFTAATLGTLTLSGALAYVDLPEISAPANPSADTARLYSKESSGTKLFFRDSAGTETQVGKTLAELTVGAKQTMWIPATAMEPRITNGPSRGKAKVTTNDVLKNTLDYDASTNESAQFTVAMPKGWNEGTVTFIPYWTHGATATNFTVLWGLRSVAMSNDDTLDAAFGSSSTSTDTGGTTDDLYIGPESAAHTIGGTPAENDLVVFEIYRDASAGGDTLAVDAKLIGVKIVYGLTTLDDA